MIYVICSLYRYNNILFGADGQCANSLEFESISLNNLNTIVLYFNYVNILYTYRQMVTEHSTIRTAVLQQSTKTLAFQLKIYSSLQGKLI